MEPFLYRSAELFAEDVALSSLARRFGTPTYVYSQAKLLENFRRLGERLSGIPSRICYSVKANSNLKILSLLRQAGAGFDVVSGGELHRVRRVGATPGSVVFSGVGKTREEVEAGIGAGILMFNVESAGELELIESRARALSKRASIAIRINPDVHAETHPYVATGQVLHKFGVPKKEATALYAKARGSKNLEVRGVACHIGSQILAVEPFLKALDEILSVAAGLRAEGMTAEFLDLGGGFGIRYADEKRFDYDGLMKGIGARLGGTPYRLILEPGRSIVGEAGILLTRVLYVKRNPQKNFIIADAGMNDLMRPALYGSHHEIIPVAERGAGKIRADVVGPLCESGDFLAQDRELADVREGDLLAILATGAYGYVLASNYNTRPRPAEVLVHGSRAELIRWREKVEDLMAGEVLGNDRSARRVKGRASKVKSRKSRVKR